MPLHLVCQNLLLGLVAMFEELLDHVVAKDIRHQLERVWKDLTEDLFFLVAVRILKLLLDEPRTMLISTKLYDVLVNVLQLLAFH